MPPHSISQIRIRLALPLLTLLSASCAFSGTANPQANAGAVDTAVAATMVFEHAVATAAAATQDGSGSASIAAANENPNFTPTPAPTATVTPSPTPDQVTIHADVDTNCRLGPDLVYTVIGYLTIGETSTVLGQLAGGGWWYIENTTAGREPCWVWGQTTIVEGDPSNLPYITPPPTPTPLPNWTGNWSTHIESQGDYSLYIQQSGDLISASISGSQLFGTLSNYDQRADGYLYSPATPGTSTPAPNYTFAWKMLSNGNQFSGYLDHLGSHYAWCGARNGYALPDPCLGP